MSAAAGETAIAPASAGANSTVVGRVTKQVANPVVDFSEVVGVRILKVTEDVALKVTHKVVDKTEELTEQSLGHDKTEQLKTLGRESVGIGSSAFYRMGGIANQFAVLVEETAMGLLGVGKAAGDIVTEGTPAGEKVRRLVIETIERLEDTTAKLTLYVGEGVEENFCGTRTEEERAKLLKDIGEGKGSFGLLLTLLAARDGPKSVPLVVRLTTDRIRDRGSRVAGLFDDVEVNETELAELIAKFDENDNVSLDGIDNIHIVVELLKRFFLELPQPLLMTKNFTRLCAAQENPDAIAEVLAELPESHQAVLEFMLAFFNRMMQDAATNGASPQTLAQAFGPLWLRAPPSTEATPEQNTQAVNVVRYIITNQDRIKRLTAEYAAKAEEKLKGEQADALVRRGANQFVGRQYAEALSTWTEALRLKETAFGRGHKKNAEIIANMVVAHTMLGTPENLTAAKDLSARLQSLSR